MISDKALSNPKRSYQVVIAATRDMGIGIDQKLPWDLPTDFKFFNDVTTSTWDSGKRNAVVMGRKTWESTPINIRPLPGRLNVVLTRSENHGIPTDEQNVVVLYNMESALELLATQPYCESIETVFVIGGGELLRNYMNAPECDAIHLTEVDISVECDAFAPKVDKELYRPWYSSRPIVENQTRFCFNTYIRRSGTVEFEENKFSFLPKMVLERHEEFSYFNLVQEIVSGSLKNDIQGRGTFSKFGCQTRFNLRRTFPLLTSKKAFWPNIVEELLWYTKVNADQTDPELDQFSYVIEKIKNNSGDRRILLTPSNRSHPKSNNRQDFAQFYVSNGELSSQVYQPSVNILDMPFCITYYALLTCVIAHVCDLIPGDLINVIGVAHVDETRITPLQEQLQNTPQPLPILKINPDKKKIDSFDGSDFELISYDP